MKHLAAILILLLAAPASADEPIYPHELMEHAVRAQQAYYVGDGMSFVYLTAPSRVTGTPQYSVEYLTAAGLRGSAKRPKTFNGNPDNRSENDDYTGSGYVRGHLASAANHKLNDLDIKATFNLANAVPQDPSMNSGLWRVIEEQSRALVDDTHAALVITVPVYDYKGNAPKTIGKNRVFVPTHLAKSVMVHFDDGKHRVEPLRAVSWLVPNAPPRNTNPASYRVSVDAIETITGLDLFGYLDDGIENPLEETKD